MLAQSKKDSQISYTGNTIQEDPNTSNSGEIGTFYKDNFIISTEPSFIINSLQLLRNGNEDEKVDEEAVKILEKKNYQTVLTALIP